MLLTELFTPIYEAYTVPTSVMDKLKTTITDWCNIVRGKMPDHIPFTGQFLNKRPSMYDEYDKIEKELIQTLQRKIQPIISNEVKTWKKHNDNNSKYVLSFKVDAFQGFVKTQGEFHHWSLDKDVYKGILYLNISTDDINTIIKTKRVEYIVHTWTNIIVHELTHAHQYIKINPLDKDRKESSHFRTILAKKQKKSLDSRYILRYNELDAFAQQAVAEEFSLRGVSGLESMLYMLQHNTLTIFGRNTLSSSSIYDVQSLLNDLKGEIPDDQIREAWKYFTKKLVKKVMWYLEQK